MHGETVQIIGDKIYIDNTLIPDQWGYFDKEEKEGFSNIRPGMFLEMAPTFSAFLSTNSCREFGRSGY
jgi:hypothetical protein